jgi:hypothetical protein
MAKYDINEEFAGYADVREYSVEADDCELQNGYFNFFQEGETVFSIRTKEVFTIRRRNED